MSKNYYNEIYAFPSTDTYSLTDAYSSTDKPSAIIKTPHSYIEGRNGLEFIDVEAYQFSKNDIYITGLIDDIMANNVVAQIRYLVNKANDSYIEDYDESNRPINIYINSGGGVIYSGLMIYDAIQAASKKVEVNLHCMGMAASMAAILFMSGKKGHRFIIPHGQVMIHEPRSLKEVGGSATSVKAFSDSLLEYKSFLVDIIAKHTGKTKKEIEKAISFDNLMDAEKAIEFGICDEIKDIV